MNKLKLFFIFLQAIILISKIIFPDLFNYKNLIIFLKLYLFLNKISFNLFYEKWDIRVYVINNTVELVS